VNAYCWAATAICIAGTIINVKRINWCFVLWAVGETMWICYDLQVRNHSRAILDAVGLALAVLGAWVNLIKPKITNKKENAK
jgi:hypothetical protein